MFKPSLRYSLVSLLAFVVILLVAIVVIVRRAAANFEHECQSLAAWVKSNHPVPGAYFGVALPASQYSLTADHVVDAAVLADGRIILVLKTSLGWHHNWSGIIYSTGPIMTSEIGTDAYGRPQIRIGGLPTHFVEKQVDAQHFEVAFDLG